MSCSICTNIKGLGDRHQQCWSHQPLLFLFEYLSRQNNHQYLLYQNVHKVSSMFVLQVKLVGPEQQNGFEIEPIDTSIKFFNKTFDVSKFDLRLRNQVLVHKRINIQWRTTSIFYCSIFKSRHLWFRRSLSFQFSLILINGYFQFDYIGKWLSKSNITWELSTWSYSWIWIRDLENHNFKTLCATVVTWSRYASLQKSCILISIQFYVEDEDVTTNTYTFVPNLY